MGRDFHALLPAIKGTVEVTVVAFAIALVLGTALYLLSRSAPRPVRAVAKVYGLVMRGIPPLTWIFIAFFGLTSVGVNLSPFTAGTAALGLIGGAYIAEFLRGGFGAVPEGQRLAGQAMGLTQARVLTFIIVPQALRAALPPTISYLISLVKDSSLVSVIGVSELTFAATVRAQHTLQGPRIFLVAAGMYLVLSLLAAAAGSAVERRFSRGIRRLHV